MCCQHTGRDLWFPKFLLHPWRKGIQVVLTPNTCSNNSLRGPSRLASLSGHVCTWDCFQEI